MAAINSFPNNQEVAIGAEPFMRWFHGRTSGVFGAEGEAAVSAVSGEMAVEISDGLGWMANNEGNGVVWWIDNFHQQGTKLKLPLSLADGVLNRIDRIVLSWQTTNYTALPTVDVLKGVLASNPVPPALTNNSTLRQISLAQIMVKAGAASITAADITDERLDPSVCGIVTDTVGLDTSMILAQSNNLIKALNDAIQQSYAEMDTYQRQAGEDWEAWFANIQGQLSGDVAGNLQNQIDGLKTNKADKTEVALKADKTDLAKKANNALTFTATLPTSGWSVSRPYKQTVSVAGMKATYVPDYGLVDNADAAEFEAFSARSDLNTQEGKIEVTYYEEKPPVDLHIRMVVHF